jgi:hypothetical protein
LSASKRKSVLLLLCILGCAIAGWLAMGDRGNASNDLKHFKSITFAGRTIDRAHSISWQGWTIGFGSRRPFAEFSEQGMTLRGLSCANAKVATTKCHLLMSMKPFESFAHFCELSPDDPHAAGSWTVRVDCPNEIRFYN